MSLIDRLMGKSTGDDILIADVQLGEICKQWVLSDIGKYVVGMAEQYEIDVMRELAITDPSDKDRIVRLQERIKIPALLLQWLEDAISEGETAQYQLNQEEE